MRTQIRKLNPNETYCCTKEDVRMFFGNDDIKIIFGIYNMSRNETRNSYKYRPNKKCNDRIIARMVVLKNTVDFLNLPLNSRLCFFIMNKTGYTDELRHKFVTEVLPKLKELYDEHKNEDPYENHGVFAVTVGLKDNEYNFYEEKAYRNIK